MTDIDILLTPDEYAALYQASEWSNDIMGRYVNEDRLYLFENTGWMHELKQKAIEPKRIHIYGNSAEGKMLAKVFL